MNQLCRVCGESAAGFHFGAFTCEGCKSFFGRTYNNVSSLGECKNAGRCIINKKNRTACKACRLRKCLLVGMSKSGSRYGRRSNWFKIHCLLEGSRSSPPKTVSNIGSETSSCGRSSEDEIDSAEVASACTLDRSPSRASPVLRSPTSPPRTSPELSIPESRASDITPEISMERMLDPGYLALYQRLSGVPLPLGEPPTYPFSPFIMPGFPSIRNSEYLLNYSQNRHLYRENHELYDFKNTHETRSQQYVHPGISDVSFRRDSMSNENRKTAVKRPSESPFEFISPKRTKLEDFGDHSSVIEKTKTIFPTKVRKWRENNEENISFSESNLPSDLDCFPEEHPVDLSMKYTLPSDETHDESPNDIYGAALILDLSIKSRIIKDPGNSKLVERSSSNCTVENATEREIDNHHTDIPEGENTADEALYRTGIQRNEYEKEDMSTDHSVPSVSVTFLNEKAQCPLNLSVKPISPKTLIQKVS